MFNVSGGSRRVLRRGLRRKRGLARPRRFGHGVLLASWSASLSLADAAESWLRTRCEAARFSDFLGEPARTEHRIQSGLRESS